MRRERALQFMSSIYKIISSDIVKSLQEGKLASGDKIPSVNEIKNRYGVSHLTALKALRVLAMEKIIKFERGKGYFAAENSRLALLGGQSVPHGIVASFVRPSWETREDDNYFNDINQAVENELMIKGFSVLRPSCCHLLLNPQPPNDALEQLKRKALDLDSSVDGFIFDERIPDRVLAELKSKLSRPMVLVNRGSSLNIDSVAPDNEGGAQQAVAICLKLGYIRFLVGRRLPPLANMDERTESFRRSLLKAGVTQEQIVPFEFNLRPYEEEFATFWPLFDGPDRILVFSPMDYFARWLVGALSVRGIKFGGQAGVLGFDSLRLASSEKPLLSTLDVGASKIGTMAAEILMGRIDRTFAEPIRRRSPEAIFKMGETI